MDACHCGGNFGRDSAVELATDVPITPGISQNLIQTAHLIENCSLVELSGISLTDDDKRRELITLAFFSFEK